MNCRRVSCSLAALLALILLHGDVTPLSGADGQEENKKPSLSLKATPPISFSPAKVRVVAEARGGADDYAEFYCPTIEWDWGDGTISENHEDCDPYEAGKSTIRRRFSAEHTYRMSGNFKVVFKLKRKTKTIAATSVSVQVRPGLREQTGGIGGSPERR
jgi:hypothetical protein